MKIAQIDTVFGSGSTGKIIQSIHDLLLSTGHKAKAYYGRGSKAQTGDVVKISSNLETYLDAGLSRLTGYTGIFSPFATRKLIEDLEAFKPDIVHIHEVHGYYLNYLALLEYLGNRRIPVLWTLHCESAYTGRCGTAFQCNQWKSACEKCPQLSDYPSSWFFDRSREQFERKREVLTAMDNVVFAPVSKWLLDRFNQSFLKHKPAQVVHNGIDTSGTFLPRDAADIKIKHKLDRQYIVLAVAPNIMSAQKGGGWVIEIARRMLDLPMKFIMIGVNERFVECPDNVICLPPISDQNELAKYYSLANNFLIVSQSETFSLTCAESLACGTPIIGFDSGGPSEVAPKPFGHFVPYGEIDELVTLLIGAHNGSLRIAGSDECVKYARSCYSNERMFQDYLAMYQMMCTPKEAM